jgi:sulfite reductase (NADPH) flavoprotein alpha-component
VNSLLEAGGRPGIVELLPPDAPFSEEQRTWLNGFFAGLLTRLAQGAGASLPGHSDAVTLKVLFASQTGTAERLARKLAKEAKGRGFAADSHDCGALSLDAIAGFGHVLVIASTHGDGEAPDAAAAFAAELAAAQGLRLAGLKYAVLALGDSSYARFCHFGRMIDERFAALGALRLTDRIEADVDVEGPYAAFRERLWPLLPVLARVPSSPAVAAAFDAGSADEDEQSGEGFSRNHPFAARLLDRGLLNGPGSDKEVRHVVLSLKDSGLTYEPGDALGVWPRQAPELVAAVLADARVDADTRVRVDGEELSLGEALATKRELTILTAATVIKFARLAGDATLQSLIQPERGAELQRFLYGKDVADLMRAYPGVAFEAQSLVDLLAPLKPRLYSISSSPLASPQEVHLTVAAVRYEIGGRGRGGVASTWLAERVDPGGAVPVFVQPNLRFRLPADPGTPVVMIGPGTGVAPFRAFLDHRRCQGLTGRTWLFFGERRAHCDFLYRAELESLVKAQHLSRLDTAFSRDQPAKVYVQHRMLEAGRELWSWLQDGAVIYVCGDATHMARDVDAALQAIIVRHGRRSEALAQSELHALAAAGRYVRDVY